MFVKLDIGWHHPTTEKPAIGWVARASSKVYKSAFLFSLYLEKLGRKPHIKFVQCMQPSKKDRKC